jgi:hypothetical protein
MSIAFRTDRPLNTRRSSLVRSRADNACCLPPALEGCRHCDIGHGDETGGVLCALMGACAAGRRGRADTDGRGQEQGGTPHPADGARCAECHEGEARGAGMPRQGVGLPVEVQGIPTKNGAEGGNRTRTVLADRGILSPLRLPVPPPPHGACNCHATTSLAPLAEDLQLSGGGVIGATRARRDSHSV